MVDKLTTAIERVQRTTKSNGIVEILCDDVERRREFVANHVDAIGCTNVVMNFPALSSDGQRRVARKVRAMNDVDPLAVVVLTDERARLAAAEPDLSGRVRTVRLESGDSTRTE